ncbi:MAG: OmpA family protein [Crocinitomicaceae bacterium]|nr:OmpA family protein [Crocinitomicaceae bacterium]
MKTILVSLLSSCLVFVSFSQQGKLNRADNFYSQLSYASAVELYTDLIGSEVDSPSMKANLADCYYQMGKTESAEVHYASMMFSGDQKPKDVYQFAQALKENGKYQESDEWMGKYTLMDGDKILAKEFNENRNYFARITNQPAYFEINHLVMNTNGVEFGGYPGKDDQIWFVSNRSPRAAISHSHAWNDMSYLDLFTSDKGPDNDLSNITKLKRKVNSKYHEGPLCFVPGKNIVYFTRNNISKRKEKRDEEGIQNLKIYRAEVDEDGNWLNEESISLNSTNYSVGHPFITEDGKTMYYTSDKPGGFGGADIYKVSLSQDGSFGEPINLGKDINTEGQEMFPWMGKDGVLFFASDGHVGLGGLDIFSRIPSKDGSMRQLKNLGAPLNSQNDDFGLTVMKDGVTGYFSSNRSTGSGDDDIYSFTLIKSFMNDLILKGLVTDQNSGDILPEATVNLLDLDGNILATTTSNEKGEYVFDIDRNAEYTLGVAKGDFNSNTDVINTLDIPKDVVEVNKDLVLSKEAAFSLYTLITDAKDNTPLEGVSVLIMDNISGEVTSIITGSEGDYLKSLEEKIIGEKGNYTLTLEKEGYVTKKLDYKPLFYKPGRYDVHGELDLSMVGVSSNDLLTINEIYFDLNSSHLRPESKVELDKIIKIMNDYPELRIELGSHTDCRQTAEYNEWLSDRRATSSTLYIKRSIFNPERIVAKGYGESRLVNNCSCEGKLVSDCSEEEHQKNRRTEFKVLNPGTLNIQNKSPNSFDK